MQRISEFEKVSIVQYREAMKEDFAGMTDGEVEKAYEAVVLPKRSSAGSAGYDFFAPVAIRLEPGESIRIPTAVRARIDDGWVLMLFPRSGLGYRYRLRLDNTVGVIDSDYYGSDNEGHIMAKITNEGSKTLELPAGKGFMQGVFMPYGITIDDDCEARRNGGFGSSKA